MLCELIQVVLLDGEHRHIFFLFRLKAFALFLPIWDCMWLFRIDLTGLDNKEAHVH